MNYYRFPDNRIVKICFPLLLLVLQMVARSTMYTSTFLGFGLSQVIMIGLVLSIGAAFLAVNRRNLKAVLTDRRMILFGISALIILVPMFIKQDWQLMYFTILLGWFFAIFLTYFTTVQELGRWYVLIMTMLSLVSLVGLFVLKPLVLAGVLPEFRFDSPGGWHMFNFGLTFVCDKNIHMDNTLRAFGIFREPGLFQIFLFIAIHMNNYWVEWKSPRQMWTVDAILFVSMLTTFATGGVFALGLYAIFLFFEKGLYRIKKLWIAIGICAVLGVLALIFSRNRGGVLFYEVYGMIEKVLMGTYSYTDRVDAVVADAAMFFSSPVIGNKLAEVVYAVPNNTATSPILFAVFGIVMGCVHVLSWAAFVWKKERHVLMNLFLMVILFIPFNTQNVIMDMFFWMFPVMALAQWCLPRISAINMKKKV